MEAVAVTAATTVTAAAVVVAVMTAVVSYRAARGLCGVWVCVSVTVCQCVFHESPLIQSLTCS